MDAVNSKQISGLIKIKMKTLREKKGKNHFSHPLSNLSSSLLGAACACADVRKQKWGEKEKKKKDLLKKQISHQMKFSISPFIRYGY